MGYLSRIDGDIVITKPGVYDIPASTYHSDPVPGGSLSSTGARKLLPPSCPALFHHWQTNGQNYNPTFEFGHAVHTETLGVGARIVAVDAKDWKTKAAKEQQAAARGDGHTPLLREQYERVKQMAATMRKHPLASVLLQPGSGKFEQSLFWFDDEFGVMRRAMLDYCPTEPINEQYIIVDVKSCESAEPGAISKAIANYGYGQQAPWYEDGFTALGLNQDLPVAYVLIFQEKDPPHLITVVQPDPDTLMWGRRKNRKALDTYRQCREADHWPGYSDEVVSVSLPGWATYQNQAAWDSGALDVTTTEAYA